MKKLLLLCSMGAAILVQAQTSFNAIKTSKRAGVFSVLNNPAELASMPQKIDINLVGFDINVSNNLVNFDKDITDKNFNELFLKDPNAKPLTVALKMDVMGPSVAYALNKKTAFALSTRGRAFASLENIDIAFANSLSNSNISSFSKLPYTIQNSNNQSIRLMNWFEVGASVSRNILNTPQHTLNVGGTVKVLFPGTNLNSYVSGFNATIDTMNNKVGISKANGELGLGFSGDIANDITKLTGDIVGGPKGVGFDFGFSYEFKNPGKKNYMFKVGASLMDIGAASFTQNSKNVKLYSININQFTDVSQYISKDLNTSLTKLENAGIIQSKTTDSSYMINLPMAFNFYTDVNIWKGFSMTVQLQRQATSNTNPRQLLAANYMSVTPRFCSKIFEIYTPFTFSETAGTFVGAGLRVGPLYLGSSSIISAIASSTKQVDFHFGIRAGFGKNK